MKKILLIAVVLFSITTFAQKTVYILNFSSHPLYVTKIVTKPTSGMFPYLETNNFSVVNGLLQSGEMLILENITSSTSFPFSYFSSQVSDMSVNDWDVTTSSSSTSTISNATAFSTYGASQEFNYASFRIGLGGSLGSFTLGTGLPSLVTGSGWTADYFVNSDPSFPNLQETIITVTD